MHVITPTRLGMSAAARRLVPQIYELSRAHYVIPERVLHHLGEMAHYKMKFQQIDGTQPSAHIYGSW